MVRGRMMAVGWSGRAKQEVLMITNSWHTQSTGDMLLTGVLPTAAVDSMVVEDNPSREEGLRVQVDT